MNITAPPPTYGYEKMCEHAFARDATGTMVNVKAPCTRHLGACNKWSKIESQAESYREPLRTL